MARSPCDRGVALSWNHVTFVVSPISIMANRIALSFGDELEGYLDVSQNFFQHHQIRFGYDLGMFSGTFWVHFRVRF